MRHLHNFHKFCFVKHKANVNIPGSNTGYTPIIQASISGHESIVNILIEHKADVNHAQNSGATA